VHPGVLSRKEMDSWVRRQAESELGLTDGALS
jgi:hypothetical protein